VEFVPVKQAGIDSEGCRICEGDERKAAEKGQHSRPEALGPCEKRSYENQEGKSSQHRRGKKHLGKRGAYLRRIAEKQRERSQKKQIGCNRGKQDNAVPHIGRTVCSGRNGKLLRGMVRCGRLEIQHPYAEDNCKIGKENEQKLDRIA